MSEQEIYRKFIDWLGKTWWGLPDSERLLPLIKARYTPEEAEFLTGFPFSGRSLEELSDFKSMPPDQLEPYLDELARKGIVFKREAENTFRYSLNDSFFVFFAAFYGRSQSRRSLEEAGELLENFSLCSLVCQDEAWLIYPTARSRTC